MTEKPRFCSFANPHGCGQTIGCECFPFFLHCDTNATKAGTCVFTAQGITLMSIVTVILIILILIVNYCCYKSICKRKQNQKNRRTFDKNIVHYGLVNTSEYESGIEYRPVSGNSSYSHHSRSTHEQQQYQNM